MPLDKWESSHRPGFTTFKAEKNGLEAILTLFIAQDHDTLIWDLKLSNKKNEVQAIDVFAYVELSQFIFMKEVGSGYYNKWMVRVEKNDDLDAVTYINHLENQPRMDESPLVYLASSEKVKSYSCNRDEFCGNYRFEKDPIAVETGICDNKTMRGGEGCAAIQVSKILGPFEEKKIYFFLGVTPGALKNLNLALCDTQNTLTKLRTQGYVEIQKDKNCNWWEEHLSILQCTIPDEDAQRQINIWNPLQCVHTARYSRSISSSASGERGIGSRDTCQDMLAQAYRKPEWAAKMLMYQASMQFEEGHSVLQSWPEEKKPPEVSTRSDQHLWMSLLAYAIIAETGDPTLLDAKVPFLSEDLISRGKNATIWEHLMHGIDFTENHIGSHGFPLILISDWNDHFGSFGTKGKGETIFVAQQHVYFMKLMAELAEVRNDLESLAMLNKLIDKQCVAIKTFAWDGEWWLRGYDDESMPVGTRTETYGNIWLNVQSWAVMGQVDEKERLLRGMNSVKKRLDSDIGIQILTPGFPTWPEVQKPAVKGLPPGCAENAGIFCQANAWAIIAEAMLGRAENAWKYYKQLIPHIALQKVGLEKYKAEPYAYVSTIFGPENVRKGWANVTQVTGTAAWMDIAATQYLLGIRPTVKGLCIDPCIPADWRGYTIRRKFRGCDLEVDVSNKKGMQKGVSSIMFDGKEIDLSKGPVIPSEKLKEAGRVNVKVEMG
jgi:cellobiose phosphorylase